MLNRKVFLGLKSGGAFFWPRCHCQRQCIHQGFIYQISTSTILLINRAMQKWHIPTLSIYSLHLLKSELQKLGMQPGIWHFYSFYNASLILGTDFNLAHMAQAELLGKCYFSVRVLFLYLLSDSGFCEHSGCLVLPGLNCFTPRFSVVTGPVIILLST